MQWIIENSIIMQLTKQETFNVYLIRLMQWSPLEILIEILAEISLRSQNLSSKKICRDSHHDLAQSLPRSQNLGGQKLAENHGEISSKILVRLWNLVKILGKILAKILAKILIEVSKVWWLKELPKCQHADPDIIDSLREIVSSIQNKHSEIWLLWKKKKQIYWQIRPSRAVLQKSLTVSDTFTFRHFTFSL